MECSSLLDLATVRVLEAWTVAWWREDVLQALPHCLLSRLILWMSPEQLERGTAMLAAIGVEVNILWRQHCLLACRHLCGDYGDPQQGFLSTPPAAVIPTCRRYARWVCDQANEELLPERHSWFSGGSCGKVRSSCSACSRRWKANETGQLWCNSPSNPHFRLQAGNKAKGVLEDINWCHVYFQFVFLSCLPLMQNWLNGRYLGGNGEELYTPARHLPWEVHPFRDETILEGVFARLVAHSSTAKREGISLLPETLERWAKHAFFISIKEPMLTCSTDTSLLHLLAVGVRSVSVGIVGELPHLPSSCEWLFKNALLESVSFHSPSLLPFSAIMNNFVREMSGGCLGATLSGHAASGTDFVMPCQANTAAVIDETLSACQTQMDSCCQGDVSTDQFLQCGVKRLLFESVLGEAGAAMLARRLPQFSCLCELSLINSVVTADLLEALCTLQPGVEVLVLSGVSGFHEERTMKAFQQLIHRPCTSRPLRFLDLSDNALSSSQLTTLFVISGDVGQTLKRHPSECHSSIVGIPRKCACFPSPDGHCLNSNSSDDDLWTDVFSSPVDICCANTLTKQASVCPCLDCSLSCLLELRLTSVRLNDASTELLAFALSSMRVLEWLSVSGCALHSRNVLRLCTTIQRHSQVQSLDLSCNSFGSDAEASRALRAVFGCSSLQHLDLSFCYLSMVLESRPLLLPSLLRGCCLKRLGLAGNRLGTLPYTVTQQMFTALSAITGLSALYLGSNLWPPGILLNDLPEALAHRKHPLPHLDITGRLYGGAAVEAGELHHRLQASVIHLVTPASSSTELVFADYISEM